MRLNCRALTSTYFNAPSGHPAILHEAESLKEKKLDILAEEDSEEKKETQKERR